MALERIVLNIIPEGEMPVFHCSQYENGRPVIIDLVSSDDDAFLVPEGATVELHCRKVDDNIVTLEPDEVDNNTVTFVSTEQLTACSGDNLCEVVLYADTDPVQTIATLNFILHVEPDPLDGGLTSETQIYNLTQQIEEITQQVIGDDYYDKTEVDDLLDDKADKSDTYTKSQVDTALNLKADKSDTYTKSQVDTALNLKADKSTTYTKTQVDSALALKADKSDTYTKTQVDTALSSKADITYVDSGLALKANVADVYTKAQTYSQAEVDALIDNIFPTLSASGHIASFTTALSKPLVSVTADPLATNITRCGVNLFDKTNNTIQNNARIATGTGGTYGAADYSVSPYIKIDNSKPYVLTSGIQSYFAGYDENKTFIGGGSWNSGTSKNFLATVVYIRFDFQTADIGTVQLEQGSTSSEYNAYNGQTVPVADATTLVTQSGINNVFADVGDVTVQYKYMSM